MSWWSSFWKNLGIRTSHSGLTEKQIAENEVNRQNMVFESQLQEDLYRKTQSLSARMDEADALGINRYSALGVSPGSVPSVSAPTVPEDSGVDILPFLETVLGASFKSKELQLADKNASLTREKIVEEIRGLKTRNEITESTKQAIIDRAYLDVDRMRSALQTEEVQRELSKVKITTEQARYATELLDQAIKSSELEYVEKLNEAELKLKEAQARKIDSDIQDAQRNYELAVEELVLKNKSLNIEYSRLGLAEKEFNANHKYDSQDNAREWVETGAKAVGTIVGSIVSLKSLQKLFTKGKGKSPES